MELSVHLLNQLRDFISEHFGIHFSDARLGDLQRLAGFAAGELGFSRLEDCALAITGSRLSKDQLDLLLKSLTVGETYFFRERPFFDALEHEIIPRLMLEASSRPARIWIAGCSTGEEAYSVAMMLHRKAPALCRGRVTIIATDINRYSLNRAINGIYTNWSFRGMPAGYQEKYFKDDGQQRFTISDEIKQMVTFVQHNLVHDPFPLPVGPGEGADLILCRNVLMYFSHETIRKIANRFHQALRPDGWFVVSQTECSELFTHDFRTVQIHGAFLYRKGEPKPAERPDAPQPASIAGHCSAPTPKPGRAPAPPAAPRRQSATPAKTGGESRTPARTSDECLALASELANRKRLDEAIDCCDRAVGLAPLDHRPYYLRAVLLQEQGRLREALSSLQKVIYLKNDSVMAYMSMGNLERQLGDGRASSRHFSAALDLLAAFTDGEVVPDSEGMPAGRLREYVTMMRDRQ